MKTTLLAATPLIGLLTLGGVLLDHTAVSAAQGQDSKAEVVIILCGAGTGLPPPQNENITVAASSSSGGAPTVQVGVQCAQALVSVLSAGFQLRDVESGNVGGVVYTLINR